MRLLSYLIINTFAVVVAAYILPGVVVSGIGTALIVAIVLGVINTILKPVLVILTLPLTILTLGLFTFVINALLVLLTSRLVDGFRVSSFWWALLFSLVLSIVSSFLNKLARE